MSGMNASPVQPSRPAQPASDGAVAQSHQLAICGATDIGASRTSNQDTFVIADLRSGDVSNPCSRADIPLSGQGILLLVCDGMGGAAAGDLAARIAAESIKQQLVGAGPAVVRHPDQSLKDAVRSANGDVLAEAKAHPEARGMGTTCTAAIVRASSGQPTRTDTSGVGCEEVMAPIVRPRVAAAGSRRRPRARTWAGPLRRQPPVLP